ncbi:MarR family winged helix-turn-helix transcriptional regulator [Paenibacillus sp. DMB20]|uniref:MarR family winged helix-turn-helix transcriptional regulator n=1 Tax=Paenibacillus sp. DMB20 TaxID=1642570 RepID=UPI0009E27E48|nr:MarR family transcriptional regulator [Paenibacillus sp. DMB20]
MTDSDKRKACGFAEGDEAQEEEGRDCFSRDAAGRLARSFSLFHKRDWDKVNISGYTTGEIKVLMTLKFQAGAQGESGMKVSEISRLMRVTSPTITQFLNGLEGKGLLERVMDEKDRRAVRVRLTPEGVTIAVRAREAFKANFRGLVDFLGEESSDELARLLTKVYTYMNENEIQFNVTESNTEGMK